jgi:hypothetical protein
MEHAMTSIETCCRSSTPVPPICLSMISLERRTSRGGRDSIDHAPGAHDDVANAVAGALVIAYKEPGVSNFRSVIMFPKA